jgi:hypothetical protein
MGSDETRQEEKTLDLKRTCPPCRTTWRAGRRSFSARRYTCTHKARVIRRVLCHSCVPGSEGLLVQGLVHRVGQALGEGSRKREFLRAVHERHERVGEQPGVAGPGEIRVVGSVFIDETLL